MKLAWDQYALDAATPQPRVPEFRTRSDTCMESDSGKRAKECGVRDRRYSVRHPFAADARLATQVNSVWQEHNQGLYCYLKKDVGASLDGRSGSIRRRFGQEGHWIEVASHGLEQTPVPQGEFDPERGRKSSKAGTLGFERMRKFGHECLVVLQDLQLPLQIGMQEIALRVGYLLERFGSTHHKLCTWLVRSTERAARKRCERKRVGNGDPGALQGQEVFLDERRASFDFSAFLHGGGQRKKFRRGEDLGDDALRRFGFATQCFRGRPLRR